MLLQRARDGLREGAQSHITTPDKPVATTDTYYDFTLISPTAHWTEVNHSYSSVIDVVYKSIALCFI